MPRTFEQLKTGFQKAAVHQDIRDRYFKIMMTSLLKSDQEKSEIINSMIKEAEVYSRDEGYDIPGKERWDNLFTILKRPDIQPYIPKDMSDRMIELSLLMLDYACNVHTNDKKRKDYINHSKFFQDAAEEFTALMQASLDMNLKETITTPDVEIKKREPIRLKISGPNAPDQPGAP